MSNSIHPDTQLGPVHLRVSQLEQSILFYTEVVGFRILQQEGKTVKLTADGLHPLLVLEEVENAAVPPRRSHTGLYHFAILLPDRKSLGLALRNLIDHQIRIGSSDHLVSEALYIEDPDHNGIEMYRDRPRDTWTRDASGEYRMAVDPLDGQGLLEEAGDEDWSGLPAGTKIGHVHLHVADLEKTKEFYCHILGFDLTAHYGDSALFVSAGGYHHHIGLNTWAGVGAPAPQPNATGLDHFTVVVPNDEEMNVILDRLAHAGIAAERQEDAWFVRDPSGIRIQWVVRQ